MIELLRKLPLEWFRCVDAVLRVANWDKFLTKFICHLRDNGIFVALKKVCPGRAHNIVINKIRTGKEKYYTSVTDTNIENLKQELPKQILSEGETKNNNNVNTFLLYQELCIPM